MKVLKKKVWGAPGRWREGGRLGGAEESPGQGLILTGAYQDEARTDIVPIAPNTGGSRVAGRRGGGVRHHASPVKHLTSKVETRDWRHWHK